MSGQISATSLSRTVAPSARPEIPSAPAARSPASVLQRFLERIFNGVCNLPEKQEKLFKLILIIVKSEFHVVLIK